MSMDEIAVFVEVVDAQGFARAADRLGMPATTVSARIARLEARLGATLIRRTTRRLHVTPAGRSYYEHCARALAAVAEGERELAAGTREPIGPLRLTAPADLIQSLLTPLIERFLATYPRAAIDLIVTNRVVDLVAEGIDLAVRAGPLEDSSLIVRRFRSARIGLWASPAYLARKGIPATSADLAEHDLIRFSRRGGPATLFSPSGDAIRIEQEGRLASDDLDAIRSFALRGNGIALLPEFVTEGLEMPTALVRVLPDYASDSGALHFVYPSQRFIPRTVRAFIALATA